MARERVESRCPGHRLLYASVVMRSLLAAALLALTAAPIARAEKAKLSQEGLQLSDVCFVGVVTARTDSTSGIPLVGERTTAITLTMQVERVQFDRIGAGAQTGTSLTIGAWTRSMGLLGGTGASGHWYVPEVGQRVRVFASANTGSRCASGQPIEAEFPNGFQPLLNACVVSGDDEYRSEVTMPLLADAIRAAVEGATNAPPATAPPAGALSGSRDRTQPFAPEIMHWDIPKIVPTATRATSFDAWRMYSSDAIALFARRRHSDPSGLDNLGNALRSGTPIVGFRTSTHAFEQSPESMRTWWNDDFPKQVFGQSWIAHHGHTSRTRLLTPEGAAKEHPILRGIQGGQIVPSWLYVVNPLPPDAIVLLWGEPIDSELGEAQRERQPILWVRSHRLDQPIAPPANTPIGRAITPRQAQSNAYYQAARSARPDAARPLLPEQLVPRRMAFTTLGHPGDFADPEVRRLAVQMVLWAGGLESAIPPEGIMPVWPAAWVPPPTR